MTKQDDRPQLEPGESPPGGEADVQQGNCGLLGTQPRGDNPPTAFDVKGLHRRLREFTDDLLRQIPVLPEGSRLEEGSTYIDLRNPIPSEFTATGDIVAGPGNRYVPKDRVDYRLWNRLIGVTAPERTGGE